MLTSARAAANDALSVEQRLDKKATMQQPATRTVFIFSTILLFLVLTQELFWHPQNHRLGRLFSHKPHPSTAQSSNPAQTVLSDLSLDTSTTRSNLTMANSLKSAELFKLLANRRSYYALNATSPISDAKIHSILKEVLMTVPSAFNSQSTRMVLALHDHHHKVWDATASAMKAKIGAEKFDHMGTGKKLDGFRSAYGTVLFYDDPTDVNVMKEKYKTYRDQFDPWSDHSNGMHQLAAWVAFEAEGFGANLQHYNPVIDEPLAEIFDVPKDWVLKAQLVFGGIEGGRPDPKDKKPLEETLRVFGAKE